MQEDLSLRYPHLDGSDSDGGVGIPPFEGDMDVRSFSSGGFRSMINGRTSDQDEGRPTESGSRAAGVQVAEVGSTLGLEGAGSPSQLRFPIVGSLGPSSEASGQSWTFPNQLAGQGSNPMTIRQEYEQMQTAKAKGEERLKQYTASKEHAKRAFPRIRQVWKDYHLKIMVAGEAGHGKTTFINNMFLSYTSGKDVKPHDGVGTSVDEFLNEPDKLCARLVIENEDTMERVHYSIQDTPGYGDDTDVEKSIRMIVDYAVRKNEEYFAMQRDYADTRALASREDPRVDVCLYFIAAHRLKLIDIKFMQAISSTVAIIPIIAKADSMTAEETGSFRRHIMDKCAEHKIRLFDFADEAKAAVGIPADLVVPPFAVVASNRFDEVRGGGSFWPVRDYLWGTCEAFSTQHSDCTYLKKLLLEEGFHELRRATEERYLEYRREAARRVAEEEERQRAEELQQKAILLEKETKSKRDGQYMVLMLFLIMVWYCFPKFQELFG